MANATKLWEKLSYRPYRSDIRLKELECVLNKVGFTKVRQTGSHRHYKNVDFSFTLTIPAHSDSDVILPIYVKLVYDWIVDHNLDHF